LRHLFVILFATFVFTCRCLVRRQLHPGQPRTPPEIVPEWYLLPFYAILRAFDFNIGPIDSKLAGVLAMFASIGVLFVLPWLDTSRVRSMRYRPIARQFFVIFVLVCVALGWCGGQTAASWCRRIRATLTWTEADKSSLNRFRAERWAFVMQRSAERMTDAAQADIRRRGAPQRRAGCIGGAQPNRQRRHYPTNSRRASEVKEQVSRRALLQRRRHAAAGVLVTSLSQARPSTISSSSSCSAARFVKPGRVRIRSQAGSPGRAAMLRAIKPLLIACRCWAAFAAGEASTARLSIQFR
jgi:hypothetical protein